MAYFPITESVSPAVQDLLTKLATKRQPPRVNLPALARRDAKFMSCWKADSGTSFVSSDFVSLEPSVTASFADDDCYRYATCDGVGLEPYITDKGVLMIDDVYLMVASVMPGIGESVLRYFDNPDNRALWLKNPEAVKDDKAIKGPRKQAKPACLGFNYGMGPRRFVNQAYDAGMNVTYEEAKKMYNAYWNLFTGIRELVQKLEKQLTKDKFIVNPFGYRLTTEPHKAYNAMIQSTASGVLDVFCYKFFALAPWAKFVAMIHDEVIYQVEDGRLDEVRAIQEDCVVSLNKDLKFRVPMRLGFTAAKTFAEIK